MMQHQLKQHKNFLIFAENIKEFTVKKFVFFIIFLIIITVGVYLSIKIGINITGGESEKSSPVLIEQGTPDSELNDREEETAVVEEEESTTNPEEDNIEKQLSLMSLEEKVGQLFIVAFRSNLQGEALLELDDYTRQQIERYKPGGIILFSQNIDNIGQTKKLIEDMKEASKIPMFIAIDEEGGIVSRLNSSEKMHATKLPGNNIIGKTGDIKLAYRVGVLIAEELSSLGFNMNFAPVADVNTNPKNPVIGARSFGAEPEMVGNMVAEMVKGMQSKGICSIIKHFPGHGDTSQDSHKGSVIINHDRNRLEEIEFVPFIKGIGAGVDGIMTAHIQVPEITGDKTPATLSNKVLTGLLRNDMNFDKLIITDALEMGAISKYWSSGDAAAAAFMAGADILLMPASIKEAFDATLDAVNNGDIPVERLDESVRRILTVKKERNILEPLNSTADPEKVLGNEEHLKLVREIKEKAAK